MTAHRLVSATFESLSEIPMWQRLLATAVQALECEGACLHFDAMDASGPPMIFASGKALAPAQYESWIETAQAGAGSGKARVLETQSAVLMGLDCLRGDGRRAHFILLREGLPTEAQLEILAVFQPALDRAIALFLQMVDTQRKLLISTSVIEASQIGLIVVNAEGLIIHANGLAEQLFAAGDGLIRHRGRLRCSRASETHRLLDLVRAQVARQSPVEDWASVETLAVTREANAIPLSLLVRPGPGYGWITNPMQRSAIIIVRDPAATQPVNADILSGLFQLSMAEAQLARQLAQGANLDDAAAALGISRNTAKTQLQSVFQKTGTSRQSDLIRMLLNSGAGMGA